MLTLSEHLDKLLQNIEPDSARAELAQALPNELRDYLETIELIGTVHPHSRLAGSYARDTAVGDIKDVDIVLFVDSKYKQDEQGDADAVLDDLIKALKPWEYLGDTGSVSPLRRQRRSVHVRFERQDFDVDVVPAVMSDKLTDPLWIPDKDWRRWIKTDPLGYGKYLSDLNGKHGKKLVPLIKILKHWRNVQMIYNQPKSYWLESLLIDHIVHGWIAPDNKGFAELFAVTLASFQTRLEPVLNRKDAVPTIADPMLGHNVAHKWTRTAFESLMRHIDEARRCSERALNADEAHEDDAIGLWQKLFNTSEREYFPAVVDSSNKGRNTAVSQALYVTAAGRVFTEAPAGVKVVVSPPHRYYGDN